MDKLQNILSLVDEYITEKHSKKTWEAGKDWVQYAGPYFTSDEYIRSIESLLSEFSNNEIIEKSKDVMDSYHNKSIEAIDDLKSHELFPTLENINNYLIKRAN